MEPLIAFAVVVALLFLATGPAALVVALFALRRAARLERTLDAWKEWKKESKEGPGITTVPRGLQTDEPPSPIAAAPASTPEVAPEMALVAVTPAVPAAAPAPAAEVTVAAIPSATPTPAPVPIPLRSPATSEHRGPALETLGVWAASVIGGVFLVVAAVLAYQIAVEHGWIGPAVRYAGGLVGGAIALAASEFLQSKRYKLPAAAVAGGGIGALYAALYAGHSLYHLAGVGMTFGLMTAVTITGVALAVHRRSQFIAILGLAGGYLTPFLLATGDNHGPSLFTYLALLDAGLLVAAVFRRWWVTAALAGPATFALYLGWASRFGAADQVPVALAAGTVFAALFLAGAMVRRGGTAVAVASFAGACLAPLAALPFVGSFSFATWDGALQGAFEGHPALPAVFLFLVAGGLQVVARLRRWPPAGTAGILCCLPALVLFGREWALLDIRSFDPWIVGGLFGPALAFWVPSLLLPTRPAEHEDWMTIPLLVEAPVAVATIGFAALAVTGTAESTGLVLAVLAVAAGIGWVMSFYPGPDWSVLIGLAVVSLGFFVAHGHEASNLLTGGLCFILLFLVVPFLARGRRLGEAAGSQASFIPWLASALAGPLLFVPLRDAWRESLGTEAIGLLPLLLGAATLAAAAVVREKVETLGEAPRRSLVAYVAVALLFACTAIPVQLENEWLTVGWALEGAALAWLSLRMRHAGIVVLSTALFGLVTMRLVLNVEVLSYHPVLSHDLLNWTLYGYGLPAIALFAGAYWRARAEGDPADPMARPAWAWFRYLPRSMVLAAVAMLFVLVNLEVSQVFAEGRTLELSGNTFAAAMTRSISWAFFGLVLLAVGWSSTRRWLRSLALGFLLLAALKVFLSDLWHLSGIIRVGSLFGVAIVLILAGLAFQRLVLRAQDEGGRT
jgi:uncharacterized membrane protein